MKKMKFAAIALLMAGSLSACGGSANTPKAKLETKADSVSYAIGLANFPPQLRSMLIQQLDGDSTAINELLKGVNDGFAKTSTKDKAYAMGLNLGQSFNSDMIKQISSQMFQDEDAGVLNSANFLSAFVTLAKGETPAFEDANEYLEANIPLLQEEISNSKFGDFKAENEKFLTENANNEGIETTESGLQYRIITEGEGEIIEEGQTVKVHYEGKLIDGTVFDSSYDRGEPAEFQTNSVVKGFKEALELMKPGAKWEVFIPQELGYGANATGDKIKPYSTLIFTIEVIEVVAK